MTDISTFFNLTGKYPDLAESLIIDYAKPNKLNDSLQRDIRIYGTYQVIKQLRKECDNDWIEYTRKSNTLTPEELEEVEFPECISSRIGNYTCKWMKKDIEEMRDTINEIMEDNTIKDKLTGMTFTKVKFCNKEQIYKEKECVYTKHELMADLTAIMETLRTQIDIYTNVEMGNFGDLEDQGPFALDIEDFRGHFTSAEEYYEWYYDTV